QVRLPQATRDPILITRLAVQAMEGLMVPGTEYVRGGVILSGLSDQPEATQLDLQWQDAAPAPQGAGDSGETLSQMVQQVTERFGSKAIGLG
ncbi:DNA polymerase V subunit UmuC, partial [Glutamicibacter creatinolyticus]